MEDLLKKFVYTGVGLVSLTVDRLQTTMDQLVKDDKITESEGKKIVDEFVNTTEEKRSDFEQKVKGFAEEALSTFKFPGSGKVEELEKRIAAIEEKLNINVAEEVKVSTPAKKAPAKKPVAKTAAKTPAKTSVKA